MRMSCNPQSELSCILGDWLLLSESHLIAYSIAARVLPRALGPYSPNVARTFLLVAKAVYIECPFFR